MKNYLLHLLTLLLLGLSLPSNAQADIQVDTASANQAYVYLNKFRSAPKVYGKLLKLNLSAYPARPWLEWNDTLARLALERATDLATRDYFAHVNPEGRGINIMLHDAGYSLSEYVYADPKNNWFESLQAGAHDGRSAIDDLIIDARIENKGHRKHLLGAGFAEKLHQVGIAHIKSYGSKYRTYTVILIASHL